MTPDQLDTLFKVGLGAGISVVSAVIIALVTHLLHKARAAEEWRRKQIAEITDGVGEYIERLNFVVAALGSARSVKAHLAGRPLQGGAGDLEKAIDAFNESWVAKGKAHTKLLMLEGVGEEAHDILNEFRLLANGLCDLCNGDQKLVSDSDVAAIAEKIRDVESRFFASLMKYS